MPQLKFIKIHSVIISVTLLSITNCTGGKKLIKLKYLAK